MKLKAGMYVRTKDGFIDKIIIDYQGYCNSPYCDCKHISCEHNYYDEKEIIKASHSLIDLIELGDYVNGQPIGEITLSGDYKAVCINCFYKNQRRKLYLESKDIKSIVTKEQFENMKYEVKE